MTRFPRMKTVLKLVFLVLTMAVALGADKSAAMMPAAPSMGAAVFRMVGSLALVIALFFGAAWVFRNMHRFKPAGANTLKATGEFTAAKGMKVIVKTDKVGGQSFQARLAPLN